MRKSDNVYPDNICYFNISLIPTILVISTFMMILIDFSGNSLRDKLRDNSLRSLLYHALLLYD